MLNIIPTELFSTRKTSGILVMYAYSNHPLFLIFTFSFRFLPFPQIYCMHFRDLYVPSSDTIKFA